MTQLLLENRWVKVWLYLLAFIFGLVVIAQLTGYLYLWHIKQNAFKATPLTAFQYWAYYGEIPSVRRALTFCFIFSASLVVGCFIAALRPKTRSQFGDARFATYQEIKRAGLLKDNGLILGLFRYGFFRGRKKFLMLDHQLSVLMAAPPRSGKGVSFVNTNNLNWSGSVVTLDIRKESWRVTSGFRSKILKQKCYLFSPFDESGMTCRWNPLSYVSKDPNLRINDLQKIAHMLFPDPAKGDAFWMASSRTLFLGIGLFLFETSGQPRTLGQVLRTAIRKDAETYCEHWGKILLMHGPESAEPLSLTCLCALAEFSGTPEKTAGNIIKSFTSKLELWLSPMIDAATSDNSFNFQDFRKKRISLYIGILPGDLERSLPLVNLMFQQILECNTREMREENPKEIKHQLLLNMDEFTSIGKIPIIANAVSFLGGYDIRLAIVIQSPSQLRAVYGHDVTETIVNCMGAQIVFAPRDTKTAEDISRSLGYQTVKSKSTSKSFGFLGISLDKPNTGSANTSEHGRALLLPQEVKQIGQDREIIFLENQRPIFAWKIRYFEESVFKQRALSPAFQERVSIPTLKYQEIVNTVPDFDLLSLGDNESIELQEEFTQLLATDVDLLEKLDLKDFNGEFEKIEVPGEPVSEEEIANLVSEFMSAMMD